VVGGGDREEERKEARKEEKKAGVEWNREQGQGSRGAWRGQGL